MPMVLPNSTFLMIPRTATTWCRQAIRNAGIKYWETNKPKRMPTYASGSWGPREADEMIEKDGMEWRELR